MNGKGDKWRGGWSKEYEENHNKIFKKEKKMKDYRDEYKTIKVPIGEEDIRLFQKLVDGKIEHFAWTFDKINVLFSKEEEEWLK